MRSENILTGEALTKSFDGKKIIEDISINVKRGELISLLGVSGVGKTTLFNILSGLELPDGGQVYLEGECITGKSGRIGYMQQSDLLLPFKRVIDNVMIPLDLKGVDKKEARAMAFDILKEFGLEECAYLYPKQLSGGMRQRAALARTMMTKCSVMLLDEPFSALDAITRGEMQRWFKDVLKKHGLSAVFITHDIDEAIILSDRIYILKGDVGRITDEITIGDDVIDGLELKREIMERVK